MKAYAILDGGGVKGAALAGALSAAAEQGIQLLGYGGLRPGQLLPCSLPFDLRPMKYGTSASMKSTFLSSLMMEE
jgi:hypothetical protein